MTKGAVVLRNFLTPAKYRTIHRTVYHPDTQLPYKQSGSLLALLPEDAATCRSD